MTTTSILMVLAAATLHASWNLTIKDSNDKLISAASISIFRGVVGLAIVAAVGFPAAQVWPWIAVSSLIHYSYVIALSAAYQKTDLAVAYPIARGTAPALAAVGGVMFLGDSISLVGALSILLIATALASIALQKHVKSVHWAVLTGVIIASYTIVDGAGVRAGDEVLSYISTTSVVETVILAPTLVKLRGFGVLQANVSQNWRRLTFGGAGSTAAYLLVMEVARTTPLGLVAALRETSTIIGVFLAAVFLKEKVAARHWVAAGVAAIAAISIGLSGVDEPVDDTAVSATP